MNEQTDARDELKRELRVFLHDSDTDDVLEAIDGVVGAAGARPGGARMIGALINEMRATWLDVETATLELHHPEAIEHAVIVAIAMQHLHDCLAELAAVDELAGDEAVAS